MLNGSSVVIGTICHLSLVIPISANSRMGPSYPAVSHRGHTRILRDGDSPGRKRNGIEGVDIQVVIHSSMRLGTPFAEKDISCLLGESKI